MADDEERIAEVVPLYPERDDADEQRPVSSEEPRPRFCGHRRTRLAAARRVFCRDCGREVDPYDVLEDLAQDIERWICVRKEAERRARITQANLEELLREERNAKARRRRREARTQPYDPER